MPLSESSLEPKNTVHSNTRMTVGLLEFPTDVLNQSALSGFQSAQQPHKIKRHVLHSTTYSKASPSLHLLHSVSATQSICMGCGEPVMHHDNWTISTTHSGSCTLELHRHGSATDSVHFVAVHAVGLSCGTFPYHNTYSLSAPIGRVSQWCDLGVTRKSSTQLFDELLPLQSKHWKGTLYNVFLSLYTGDISLGESKMSNDMLHRRDSKHAVWL